MPEVFQGLRVKLCELGGDPMLLGAGVLAFEQMLGNPLTCFKPHT